MLAVLGALSREVAPIRHRMAVSARRQEGSCRLWEGRYRGLPLLLGQTGMGRAFAEEGAALVLSHYPVTMLLSIGFAGGLRQNLAAGTVCSCGEIYSDSGQVPMASVRSDGHLLELCRQARIQRLTGVTSGSVSDAAAKNRLGHQGADVVDMESYWIGLQASSRGIPFLSLRSVSDTLEQAVPPDLIDARGRVRTARALARLASRPGEIKTFYRLYRGARLAQQGLFGAVDGFIASLQEDQA